MTLGGFPGGIYGGLGQLGASARTAAQWWLAGGISAANCLAAYLSKGAASLAASYVNLNNPGTYDAAPGVAPTLGADGWGFNGIDKYLTTGIMPTNAKSMVIRFSEFTAYRYLAGSFDGTRYFGIIPWNPYYLFINGDDQSCKTGTVAAAGVVGFAGAVAYQNGLALAAPLIVGAPSTNAITIGARNNGATRSNFYAGNILAAAFYSSILTAPQFAAVSAAMAAL